MKEYFDPIRCICCGEEYMPYALGNVDSIPDADFMCKNCLMAIIDGIYKEEEKTEYED